jgi:hypothetical protein
VQNPLLHSDAVWQPVPLAFLVWQTALLSQNCVDAQGAVALHPVEHRIPSAAHRLLMQVVIVAMVHTPAPLHTVALVAVPFEQDPGTHWIELPGKVHLVPSVPPQAPLQGEVPAHATRDPRGAPMTGVHLPTEPASAQLSHWPAQALSQQTPSTQFPVAHSAVVVQAEPLVFLVWQTPFTSQKDPAAQVWVALQVSRQVVVFRHWRARQALVVAIVHPPALLHTDAVVPIPLVQVAVLHTTDEPG